MRFKIETQDIYFSLKPTVVLYFAVIMCMCITIVATFVICNLHVNSKDNIDYRKCHLYIVGLDGAGKTTLLYRIKLGEVIDAVPSIGRGAKGFCLHYLLKDKYDRLSFHPQRAVLEIYNLL